jgi:hypothetical protein
VIASDTTIEGTTGDSSALVGAGASEIPHMSAVTADCRVELDVLAAYNIIDILQWVSDYVVFIY